MSALNGVLNVAAVSLTAATTKTLWQLIAPTNHRLKLKEVGVSFVGVVNTDGPVRCQLLYATTAGTSSALTPVKEDDSLAETLLATALQTFTVEPTAGNVIRTWECHPQAGIVIPAGLLDEIIIGGGKRIGLRCTAPQAQTVSSYARYEE